MARKADPKTLALVAFCSAIEAAGGVWKSREGAWVPQIAALQFDLDALGEAYLDACLALDRLPKLAAKPCEGDAG